MEGDNASHAESDDEVTSLPTAMDLIAEVDSLFSNRCDRAVTISISIPWPLGQLRMARTVVSEALIPTAQ